MQGHSHIVVSDRIQFRIISVDFQRAAPRFDGPLVIPNRPIIPHEKIQHSAEALVIAYSVGNGFGLYQTAVELVKLTEKKKRVTKFQSKIDGML